jgi:hypothetical protein
VARRDRAQGPGHAPVVAGGLDVERAGERDRAHDLAPDERRQEIGRGFLAGRLEHGRRQRRGQERARRARPAELLEHDGELRDAVPLPAERLVDVDPEPALRRQLVPERRAHLVLGLETGPRDRRRAVAVRPASHRPMQRLVLLRDPDRHGLLLRHPDARSYAN